MIIILNFYNYFQSVHDFVGIVEKKSI